MPKKKSDNKSFKGIFIPKKTFNILGIISVFLLGAVFMYFGQKYMGDKKLRIEGSKSLPYQKEEFDKEDKLDKGSKGDEWYQHKIKTESDEKNERDGDNDDELQIMIQDDLTSLDKVRIVGQGYLLEDE